MSQNLNAETRQVKPVGASGPTPLDPLDAMLRGRTAQEPFLPWIAKRLRGLYPK